MLAQQGSEQDPILHAAVQRLVPILLSGAALLQVPCNADLSDAGTLFIPALYHDGIFCCRGMHALRSSPLCNWALNAGTWPSESMR